MVSHMIHRSHVKFIIFNATNPGISKSGKPKIWETQNPGNSKSRKLKIRETQNPGAKNPGNKIVMSFSQNNFVLEETVLLLLLLLPFTTC